MLRFSEAEDARMAKTDWARHIEAWQGSGFSQAAYCRRQGLSAAYF